MRHKQISRAVPTHPTTNLDVTAFSISKLAKLTCATDCKTYMPEIHKQSNVASRLDGNLAAMHSGRVPLGGRTIFGTNKNRVPRLSSATNNHAKILPQTVLIGANLSAQRTRTANAISYRCGTGRNGVLASSLMRLGFESVTTLALTMKLIISVRHHHPNIDMSNFLVRARLVAALLRVVATYGDGRDVDKNSAHALLPLWVDITGAFWLPEQCRPIQQRRAQAEPSITKYLNSTYPMYRTRRGACLPGCLRRTQKCSLTSPSATPGETSCP